MSKKQVDHQRDFFEGKQYYLTQAYGDRGVGYRNLTADVEEHLTGEENVRWIKSTNYKVER